MSKIICGVVAVPALSLPYGYNESELLTVNLKIRISEIFSQLASQGSVTILTSGEFGVPLWCAEIAAALKLLGNHISFSFIIPFEEHNIKWYEDWRDRYYTAIESAEHVSLPDEEYTESCKTEQELLLACDEYITDNCNVLLAVYVGESVPAAVKIAKENKTPVILLNAESLEIMQS